MAAGSPRGALVRRALTGRSVPGLLVGWVAILISLSPSLLPRPWHLQAAASAGSAVVAYAAGTLLAALCTPVFAALGVRVLVDPQRRRRAAITAIVGIVVGTLTAWVAGHRGRVQTARLVGITPPSWWDDLLAFVAAFVLAATLLTARVAPVRRGSGFPLPPGARAASAARCGPGRHPDCRGHRMGQPKCASRPDRGTDIGVSRAAGSPIPGRPERPDLTADLRRAGLDSALSGSGAVSERFSPRRHLCPKTSPPRLVARLRSRSASMPRPRMPRSTSRRLRQPWCGSWSARARSSGRCSPS